MNIADFFKSFDYDQWVTIIKFVFGGLAIFFFLLALFSMYKVYRLMHSHHDGGHGGGHGGGHKEEHSTLHSDDEDEDEHSDSIGHGFSSEYAEQWSQIRRFAESTREAEWKLSIIEADKLVDDFLKQAGYPGETMGERLMLIKPDQLASLQDLWDAHKLRNLFVHDANYQVRHEQVLEAMNAFDRVLRELGAIA